jgi:hypothetical protein
VSERPARQFSPMPLALSDRAADNLRFIRETIAHAGAFTSVSGMGMITAGVIGLAAAAAAPPGMLAANPRTFLTVWVVAALAAGAVSWGTIRRKAARTGQSLVDGPARRFALAFAPAIVAGAVLTVALVATGNPTLLPGTWLSLYGAAVTAGGALSVRPVPVMGAAFMACGALCFALAPQAQQYMLAAGFGGLHLIFGYHISRNYGG